jgi:hypothetical protein
MDLLVANHFKRIEIDFFFRLGESRSLKELCRLTIRRYCFNTFNDGFKRLSSLQFHNQLNHQLFNFIMFNKDT